MKGREEGHIQRCADRQEVSSGKKIHVITYYNNIFMQEYVAFEQVMYKLPVKIYTRENRLVKMHFIFRHENSPSARARSQLGMVGNCCFYISVSFSQKEYG